MTYVSVGNNTSLTPEDSAILTKYFHRGYSQATSLEVVTVDGEEFTLHVRPDIDGTLRQIALKSGIRLPGHTATLVIGDYSYDAELTFCRTYSIFIARIPMFGIWKSGRVKTYREQL